MNPVQDKLDDTGAGRAARRAANLGHDPEHRHSDLWRRALLRGQSRVARCRRLSMPRKLSSSTIAQRRAHATSRRASIGARECRSDMCTSPGPASPKRATPACARRAAATSPFSTTTRRRPARWAAALHRPRPPRRGGRVRPDRSLLRDAADRLPGGRHAHVLAPPRRGRRRRRHAPGTPISAPATRCSTRLPASPPMRPSTPTSTASAARTARFLMSLVDARHPLHLGGRGLGQGACAERPR